MPTIRPGIIANVHRVTTRNASFQQWQALLTNRTKRQRLREFVVQGVRPISLAVSNGWAIRALIYSDQGRLSDWAKEMLSQTSATHVAMAPELLGELSEKADGIPEMLAIVELPADDLARIPVSADMHVVVFDRPTAPGNIGALVRSADAFGASSVVVTGHAADPYDPKAVRASTGSLFAVPVVRSPSHHEVLSWVERLRANGVPLTIVGTDEGGDRDVSEYDYTGATLTVIGNETHGLSASWRQACDYIVRIPMAGSASSLNAAAAGTVVLYESRRQRGH